MGYVIYIVFCALLLPTEAFARPISYPGGWTLMSQNNWERSRAHLHYSPNASNSYGVSTNYFHREERKDFNFQWNNLLFRQNTRNSQANIYLRSETGVAYGNSRYEPNIRFGGSTDWETRRYFASYTLFGAHAGDLNKGSLHQRARLGIAPYLGNYGDLHAWMMFQIDHNPQESSSRDQLRFTPLLRFFKGDYLGEFGIDNEKQLLFNFIIRY